MSEYQHYEWHAVDRPLTEAEQEAVGGLSSHIEVSSWQAVVTYAWGDFKHDPRQVLLSFFDAHLYLANWGSRRLMFRFPTGLLSREVVEPFSVQDRIEFTTVNAFDLLEIDLSEEEDGFWVDAEGSLSSLTPLRKDLLQGDYRCVYLAWLKAMSYTGGEMPHGRRSRASRQVAPAVPPGLRRLTPALAGFVEQFDVPPFLVEAAAEISPELAEAPATDFRPLVAQLPREECDGFLSRMAQGDASAGMELRKRLRSLMPRPPSAPEVRRSFAELQKRADAIEAERQRRHEEEARKKHEAEMNALASREEEAWQKVASLVDLKQTKGYDASVQLLAKLSQLAEFRGSKDDYRRRVSDLCERYSRLSGFTSRVRQAKLLE